eukprot:s2147_g3.t1
MGASCSCDKAPAEKVVVQAGQQMPSCCTVTSANEDLLVVLVLVLVFLRDVDFDVGVLLGRGTFTSVYRAVEKATGKRCAMKIVDRYRCERLKKTADVFMEKHCLLRTNHPNIVKMLGWFSDNTCIYVMLEECLGGELWEVIKTVGCPIPQARHCLKQVVNAVENIMLTELATVKLIDFGTAKDLENPQIKGSGNASRHKVFEDYVGTPQFMPKEVIENKCSDQRSDIWSFGCTIFQVLSGCPPFHDRSEYLIFQRVLARDLQFPPGIDATAKDLIERMVVQDPDARLGALDLEDLKAHPFFHGHTFERAHLLPVPVPSLAALCYQRLGSRIEQFLEPLAAWEGAAQLAPAVREQLERMKFAHRWQEEDSRGVLNQRLLAACRDNNIGALKMALEEGAFLETRRPFVMRPKPPTGVFGDDATQFIKRKTPKEGLTPLMYASQNGSVSAVHMLLEARANIMAKDEELPGKRLKESALGEDGMRPLHFGARSGVVEVCRLLVKKGADALSVDDDGNTALDLVPSDQVETAAQRKDWEEILGPPTALPEVGEAALEKEAAQLEADLLWLSAEPVRKC